MATAPRRRPSGDRLEIAVEDVPEDEREVVGEALVRALGCSAPVAASGDGSEASESQAGESERSLGIEVGEAQDDRGEAHDGALTEAGDEAGDRPLDAGLDDRLESTQLAGELAPAAGDAPDVEDSSGPEAEDEAEAEPEDDTGEPALADPIQPPALRGVNALGYALARGLRGMGQSPLVQLLAVGTTAVCMLLLGTALLLFSNARSVARDLGVEVPVTVFMQPEGPAGAGAALAERLEALPEVERAEAVAPEQALARLAEGLGEGPRDDAEREHQALLAGVDASMLPDTVELRLVAGVEPGFADALAERVRGMEGVDEVASLGPWVQQAEAMLRTLRWLALGVGLLVSLACLAIIWSTIRLAVFARRSEIEILRLVGGTSRFVRGPFVVEGVLQGVLGTALALAGLYLAFELVRPFLERGLSLMFAAGSLEFFSLLEVGLALGLGALFGIVGARAAVARHAQA